MEIIKNQTLFRCSHCRKRLLTKKGCLLHENKYCWHPKSPNKTNIIKNQEACPHTNRETEYEYIPGEAVKEPAYDRCLDCGKKYL